jgi:hypothetical protein
VLAIFVPRRITSAVLIVAVAAYATFATAEAERVGGRFGIHAGSNQPAVCPVTRPSLQLGRQTEVRPGLLLATLAGLPAEAPDLSRSPGWVRSARIEVARTVASAPACSSRTTRGPPQSAS